VFSECRYSVQIGTLIVAFGALLYWLGLWQVAQLSQHDNLSLKTFSFIVCLIGGFISFYGSRAFRKGMFPLLFLVSIIPFPTLIIESLTRVLMIGSAETSYAVFKVLGIPVYRNGFIFELPGIAIEVAKQCSGINSTIALLLTCVLAGNLFLRTGWRRAALVICIFPVTIFKNSLRIVTISMLASYVDPIFLTNHWLHSSGGKPFFVLAMLFMVPVLWLLRRSEKMGEGERLKDKGERIEGKDKRIDRNGFNFFKSEL